MDLNYPFRQYPIRANNILTPFINSEYINNVKKLYHDIENLSFNVEDKQLVILVIGSLIDENNDRNFSDDSYHQHLPLFVRKYLEENDNSVKIICVSPRLNGEPQFIKKTKHKYGWYKYENNKYISSNFNLTYDFYYTLFPEHIDSDYVNKNGKSYYLKYNQKYCKLPMLYYRNTNYKRFYQEVYDYYDQKILRLKDNLLEQIYDIYNSSPTDNDKIFVNMFHEKLTNLTKELEKKSGSLLVLNYSVFCSNWICTSFYYFFETLYKNLESYTNVKFLTYSFVESKSDELIEYKKKSYNYEDNEIILEIKRKGRISINKHFSKNTKENANVNSEFKIIEINGDGDCLFNSILKQCNNNMNIDTKDLRKIVVNEINSNDNLKTMVKEEVSTMNEYSKYVENNLDEALNLHLYFIKEGPYCKDADKMRERLKLPFSVFFGGDCEIGILSKLFSVNIKIVNYDDTIINVTEDLFSDTIYIKFNGNHYDIAVPINNRTYVTYSPNNSINIVI